MKTIFLTILTLILLTGSAFCTDTNSGQDEIDAMGATKQNVVTEGSLPDKTVTGADMVDETVGATQLAKAVKSVNQPEASFATGTLTLVAGQYAVYNVHITGAPTESEPYVQIALSEADATPLTVPNNAEAYIFNDGATDLYMIGIAGQQVLAGGPIYISQGGSAKFKYITDHWELIVQPVADTTFASGMDLSPTGIITGANKILTFSSDVTLMEAQLNSTVYATAALTISIPANQCDTATGVHLRIMATGAFAVEVQSLDASDQFILLGGTAVTAGNAITLDATPAAGDWTYIECGGINKLYVFNGQGVGADAGGAAGFCDTGCAGDVTVCWIPASTTVDCSDGDTTATAVGDVALAGGKVVVTNASDYYTLALSSGDLANPEVGSVEFKVNVGTWVAATKIFYLESGGTPYVYVGLSGESGTDIEARIRATDGTNTPIATTSVADGKDTGSDLRIRAMWRETGTPNLWVEICDADGTNCTSWPTGTDANSDIDYNWSTANGEYLQYGNVEIQAAALTTWDLKVYSTWQGWNE